VLGGLAQGAALSARSGAAIARSGLLAPERPDKLARLALEVARRGPFGAACTAAAIRWGDRPALTDELGTLTYTEIDRRSNAIARAWSADGVKPGDTVAILCRNHRGFVESCYAAAKSGVRAVYMNTEFAGPQIADVCEREGARTLVFDSEYADRAPDWADRHYCAWSDTGGAGPAQATLEELIAEHDGDASGTTGTPKGAPRSEVGSANTLGSLLSRVPFRTRGVMHIAPPMFHAFGFAHLSLGLSFGSKVVTRRRFKAEELLADIAAHGATSVIVVPAMLQRVLELGPERIGSFDSSSVKVIFCAGSQLPGSVATNVLDAFGDVLYVLYGSTEVAYASISIPADHRAAPTTVGKPVPGAIVKLLDDEGREVGPGETGRIFVSNGIEFEGYTDGQTKEVIDGLMSTGDVGHFDSEDRLYIDGRDDEMIVSGGENVFPQEVEELLLGHPDVADAAVVGVDDENFGKRLAAYVVRGAGPEVGEQELKEHVRANLARYKVPRDVHFIDELPRNATGKVLKRELAGD
jgi:fatty-acyl-CoA synthase